MCTPASLPQHHSLSALTGAPTHVMAPLLFCVLTAVIGCGSVLAAPVVDGPASTAYDYVSLGSQKKDRPADVLCRPPCMSGLAAADRPPIRLLSVEGLEGPPWPRG